jgi:hypothetical protein
LTRGQSVGCAAAEQTESAVLADFEIEQALLLTLEEVDVQGLRWDNLAARAHAEGTEGPSPRPPGDLAGLRKIRRPAPRGEVVPQGLACGTAADLAVDEVMPALWILKDLLEQVALSGDRLGDAEQVCVSAELGGEGVEPDLLLKEILGVVLATESQQVEPLYLGVRQNMLSGVAAAVVLPSTMCGALGLGGTIRRT